jgi:hypothetical protein
LEELFPPLLFARCGYPSGTAAVGGVGGVNGVSGVGGVRWIGSVGLEGLVKMVGLVEVEPLGPVKLPSWASGDGLFALLGQDH